MIVTNKWSCVLDSFAHSIDIHPNILISEIGHDGYEIGFHTQELIETLLTRGYSVTEIHRNPIAVHPNTGEHRSIIFDDSNDMRFAKHLNWHVGVLLGFTQNNRPHSVSWKLNRIHDPAIVFTEQKYELLRRDSEGYLVGIDPRPSFTPTKFLRISKTI